MAKVTISCDTSNASIRYTIDGTEPSENSALYSSPLTIEGATLKARGFKTGLLPSDSVSLDIPDEIFVIGYNDNVIGYNDNVIGWEL